MSPQIAASRLAVAGAYMAMPCGRTGVGRRASQACASTVSPLLAHASDVAMSPRSSLLVTQCNQRTDTAGRAKVTLSDSQCPGPADEGTDRRPAVREQCRSA